MTKKCWDCGVIKSLEGYYKDKQRKDGVMIRCKACHNAYMVRRNKDTRQGLKFKWNKFNLSLEEYDSRLHQQGPMCAICGVFMTRPELDHCHETGKLRDFLCNKCNQGIGQISDKPSLLCNAINYLSNNT